MSQYPPQSGPSPFGTPQPAPQGPQPAPPSASQSPTPHRGPGWLGTSALVLAGMVLSSGLTVGGVVGYDLLSEGADGTTSTTAPATTDSAPADPASTSASPDWNAVADRVGPSTVAIETSTPDGTAQGTGVIRGEDGTIITNNHVVAGSEGPLRVSLADGRMCEADVVGTDASTDLAVIRLVDPPDGLTPARFGDSDAVTVGQPVMALGTPLGLQNIVTTGIISALHRPVSTSGERNANPNDATYTSALQTDAAVNPGNSGGPLVNAAGEVVGINSSIASFPNAQQQAGSIGLGFAIPSRTVQLIADQLAENGSAQHAFLGVTARSAEAQSGAVTRKGAEVQEAAPDSAAAAAGVQTGDLIVAVDDIPVDSASGLTGVVRGLEIGSKHTLTVLRDGQEQDLTVTLGSSE